jgi:hypothetical protein
MKRISTYIAVLTMILLAVSCRKEPSLTITPDYLEATSEGGNFEFPVTANYEWTASCSASWVRVTVNEDGTRLIVSVSQNLLPDDRETSVTLVCEELIKSFRIHQAQKDMAGLDGGDVSVSWEQQTFEVGLKTNVDFTVDIDMVGDWLTLITTKGLVSKSLVFEVKENAVRSDRTAKLDIKYQGTVLKSFTITQTAYPNILTVLHNLSIFPAPMVFGEKMKAAIDWGDGTTATYNSSVSHSYDTEGEHEVRIEATGAEYTSMPSLVGVLKVDLSDF